MNKENQISLIEKFISSNEKNIIINQVNEEYGLFYLTVVKYFAKKKKTLVLTSSSSFML